MIFTSLDEKWTFRRGYLDSYGMLGNPGEEVNLPHDGMIGTPVSEDAPAGADMGYFTGGLTNYTKYVFFPKEWENDCVGLQFDGAMVNANVDVNGSRIAQCHYGYAPFYVDLTDHVTFGEENRITVNLNTSMQPNSRWYTGSGLYRGVRLAHSPRVHIVPDGIYVFTKEVSDGYAFLEARVEVENVRLDNRMARVSLMLCPEGSEEPVAATQRVIFVGHGKTVTAIMALNVKDPMLWDAENPNLYRVKAVVSDIGEYRTHITYCEDADITRDEAEVLFGIRTITADSVRGLRINGRSVKLKGGCLHHDNGLLGSVTMTAVEERKIRKLKEVGFNAIRTAHNPPSAALIEACDRIGMYVFDEAFDAWFIGKRAGDYHHFFAADWEKDLTAFVKRDRTHPSVIMWSTGNEIPERAGLANGYERATSLAETIRSLDGTRPISNGICSFWSGLDDKFAKTQNWQQNAAGDISSDLWEVATEPFTNGMDIVGYNYMEDLYEHDHEMFPERVLLGSENFPKEIGFRWPLVEKHPYIIGDFTWTAWDYLGEAGIGKSRFFEPDDPFLKKGPWAMMPGETTFFPWRTANDSDFDITGHMRPQGAYRSVVWGNPATFLYSVNPKNHGKEELISPWGFPDIKPSWNYGGYEGKPVELVVFSAAEEVEILINGVSAGRKKVSAERPLPESVRFETVYTPGRVEAVSYTGGKEVSRTFIETTGEAAALRIVSDKTDMRADGHDVIFAAVEVVDSEGRIVPDAAVCIKAATEGEGKLAAFGSGNPITQENYTDGETTCFDGRALAVIRSGYEAGGITLTVEAEGLTGDSAVYSTLSIR